MLGIDLRETPALRELHNRLNRELPPIFGDVRADFDGDEYHFHMTVAMGGASAETYKAIFAACTEVVLPGAFIARELGLFTGYQTNEGGWQYMLHTVLPLGPEKSRGVIRIYWIGDDGNASTRYAREAALATVRDIHSEDVNVILGGQRGISSGALEHIHFQEKEVLCRHLIEVVREQVAAYQADNK